ncbi:CHY zinc finger-domain-containing protein, partial [Syncephalis pseudoplumigaleata]
LPDNGACKHYRRSHRWMRFPCCGKCYPCDVCHDTAEDHPHERANRMICGYCSLEQAFADKICPCGAAMGSQKQREFWEGGAGMRNRMQMNRR